MTMSRMLDFRSGLRMTLVALGVFALLGTTALAAAPSSVSVQPAADLLCPLGPANPCNDVSWGLLTPTSVVVVCSHLLGAYGPCVNVCYGGVHVRVIGGYGVGLGC